MPGTVKRLESFGDLWKLRGQIQAAQAYNRIPGKTGEAAKLYEAIGKPADAHDARKMLCTTPSCARV